MVNISWHHLEQNARSKELSFESFCFQIAKKKYNIYGNFESCYNSAGSEFYLELTKDCDELNLFIGDVIGWQAKFWFNNKDIENSPLDSEHIAELVSGFKKSFEDKPNLKCWYICTPGKFLNNKPHYPWKKLLSSIYRIKSNIQIEHWHKDIFEAIFHSNPDEYSSIFNHYFNAKFIGINKINDFSKGTLNRLESKFDVELYIQDEKEIPLINSISLESGKSEIEKSIDFLKRITNDIEDNIKLETISFKDLPQNYIVLANAFLNKHILLISKILELWNNSNDTIVLANSIYNELIHFIEENEIDRVKLNLELSEFMKENDRNPINFKEIDWNETHIKYVKDLRYGYFNKENYLSLLNICHRLITKEFHVFGRAGNGKTNFACSIAYKQIKNNLPVLLLLGSGFNNNTPPKERILQLLDLTDAYNFNEFLGALNNLGILKNTKIPIIIDGLNESSPSSGAIWNQEIYFLIEEIRKFSNLILITTCREKSEYIQQIFNKIFYSDIENYIYLEGFTDKNIDKAIEKYFIKKGITVKSRNFDKSLFKYPLRLKIFAEVNSGEKEIEINVHAIVNSIDKYMDEISRNVSKVNNSVDKIIENRLRNGLKEVGCLLWSKNSRDLKTFVEFQPIFDNNNINWCESLTFKLIDEGLCFQRELKGNDDLIQFSIDIICGYQIAKSVFFSELTTEEIINKLKEQITKDKLYGQNNFKRHPVYEDILIAISYLLPLKTGKQIHEIYNDSSIIIESINNLELLAFNQEEKQKLINFMNNISLDINIKFKIIHKLYSDAFQKNYFSIFDLIEDVFLSLNQFEIDANWCELIRKDTYKHQEFLKNISIKLSNYKDSKYNVILYVALLTASTDKKLRNDATKTLMQLGLQEPNILLKIFEKFKLVNDKFILESLICSITGVVLRLKNKILTENTVKFLTQDFLNNNLTNHIAILDYIKTIFDFALIKHDIIIDGELFYRNKNEVWDYNKEKIEEIKSSGFWEYKMMDYDFIKYKVSSISNNSYNRISKYSKAEIIAFLSNRIILNGYDNVQYNEIENNLKEDNKYGREIVSEKVIKYSEKYLNIAFMELSGYLMLNKQIKPEYENSFRFNDVNFDPTFPEILCKTQLLNDCFLPQNKENVQDWIIQGSSDLIMNIYITIPVFEKSEMVLLSASINQKNENSDTRLMLSVDTYLFNKCDKKNIRKKFNSSFHDHSNDISQIFAGEIPWKEHLLIRPDDDNMDFILDQNEYLNLVTEYSWSSWSSSRHQNPHFIFVNPIIAKKMGIDFDVETLSYFNENGLMITKYYKTIHSEFLFIERNTLDNYLKENNYDLVWNKFIAKYGDFENHNETKLNPSYKDFKNIDFYSDFKS